MDKYIHGKGVVVSDSAVNMLEQLSERDCLKSFISTHYKTPLISVALNIPVVLLKELEQRLLSVVFHEAMKEIEALSLFVKASHIVENEHWAAVFFDSEMSCCKIKAMLIEIEERHPLGRLFDLDLYEISCDGLVPFGRVEVVKGLRECFLCSSPAVVCRRSKTHSKEELKSWLTELTGTFYRAHQNLDGFLKGVNFSISQAITLEAVTTPKPGLVDCRGTGVHNDMDLALLLKSAHVIAPYIVDCARVGAAFALEGRRNREELLGLLRSVGRKAEKAMFLATEGVNTHKGIIFTGGLLSGAAGFLWGQGEIHKVIDQCDSKLSKDCRFFAGRVAQEAAAIAHSLVESDLEGLSLSTDMNELTNGERNWIECASPGIRGEAVEGFPSILNHGLPQLIYSEAQGYEGDRLQVRVLLSLIAVLDDGNILSRGGSGHLSSIQELAGKALVLDNKMTGGGLDVITISQNEYLESLDDYCLQNNLSSGGAADMLAATLFLNILWKKLRILRKIRIVS